MRISIVGGMSRLEGQYRREAEKFGHEVRVYNRLEVNMSSKLARSGALVLFTGKISHEARIQAVNAAKACNIHLLMRHSSGVCAFRDCLSCLAGGVECRNGAVEGRLGTSGIGHAADARDSDCDIRFWRS